MKNRTSQHRTYKIKTSKNHMNFHNKNLLVFLLKWRRSTRPTNPPTNSIRTIRTTLISSFKTLSKIISKRSQNSRSLTIGVTILNPLHIQPSCGRIKQRMINLISLILTAGLRKSKRKNLLHMSRWRQIICLHLHPGTTLEILRHQ